MSGIPKWIVINYKGSIEGSKVPAMLQNYHIFIMPSEGENFGHAILEALSCGCPVIISDQTPWKGLETKTIGWDLPIRQADRFISAIESAARMDQETYNEWSEAAYRYARNLCNNPGLLEASRKLFTGITCNTKR